jgi:glucosamine-6-phosphate deaminase
MAKSHPQYTVIDRLAVEIHGDRKESGRAAARAAAAYLSDVITLQGDARVVFACAPSQDDFFAALLDSNSNGGRLDWSRVTAFHMDDYVGLSAEHPQSFRHYLERHLLSRVRIGRFHPLPAEEADMAAVCARYATLLRERPIDLICLGIGENGHIAFNDPLVADFDDPASVKIVELDPACRQQQVNDGCFTTLTDVPRHALTLTVPIFRQARRLSICVPGLRKAAAVRSTLCDAIAPTCPASILRLHPCATLYLDSAAATELEETKAP